MDNNNSERNMPDISFGSGAPAGMLDKEPQKTAPAGESVSLEKPSNAPAGERVSLGKPANAPAAERVSLDKPAGAPTAAQPSPSTVIHNEAAQPPRPAQPQQAATGQLPRQAQQTGERKPAQKRPVGATNEGADIGANFGSKTPELRKPARNDRRDIGANFGGGRPIDNDKTKPFVAPPHSGTPADVNPEADDVTKHFGKASQTERSTAVLDFGSKTATATATRPAPKAAAPEPPAEEPVISEAPARPAPARRRRPRKKKKEHMFNTSIITGLTITIVVISASIVLATGGITLGMEYLGYNKSDKQVTFNIPEGADSEQIIDLLIENKIINNRNLFKAALRIVDEPILYPGDITLKPSTSYPEIIKTIGTQRELYETVTLTFQEGTNLRAVAAKLEKNGICSASDFLWQFNKKLDMSLDSKINHSTDVYMDMEGYFFPDTYEFYKNDSAYNVSKIVRENFDRKITAEMYTRMNEMGMDLNQVITLASIVQREAGDVSQMPDIASVFLNRLKDPQTFPNLQSDATKNYVENVIDRVETSTAMLEHYKNVYDTYTCFGLPAGPVCCPGLDAINAVLYPSDTKYYYFCHDINTGEAFYAQTYDEHKKNLKKAGLKE